MSSGSNLTIEVIKIATKKKDEEEITSAIEDFKISDERADILIDLCGKAWDKNTTVSGAVAEILAATGDKSKEELMFIGYTVGRLVEQNQSRHYNKQAAERLCHLLAELNTTRHRIRDAQRCEMTTEKEPKTDEQIKREVLVKTRDVFLSHDLYLWDKVGFRLIIEKIIDFTIQKTKSEGRKEVLAEVKAKITARIKELREVTDGWSVRADELNLFLASLEGDADG